jgi:hypothetical protein
LAFYSRETAGWSTELQEFVKKSVDRAGNFVRYNGRKGIIDAFAVKYKY